MVCSMRCFFPWLLSLSTVSGWQQNVVRKRLEPQRAVTGSPSSLVVSALERAVKHQQHDRENLGKLVTAASKVKYGTPRELSRACWAVAKLSKGRELAGLDEFFACVAESETPGGRDEPRRVATLLWALATCRRHHENEFVRSLARRAGTLSPRFNAQDCAQTAWALAKLNQTASLDAVADRALVLNDVRACEAAQLSWAYAKVGRRLDVLTRLAEDVDAGELTPRQVAIMAWALAKTQTATKSTLDKLATRASVIQKPGEMANLAWSYATARRSATSESKKIVFDAVATNAMIGNRLDQFDSHELANVAWAFAKCERRDDALFLESLSKVCVDRLHEFGPQELANCAWALAKLNVVDTTMFFDKLLLSFKPYRYASQGLSMTAWALATVGHDATPEFWTDVATVASHRVRVDDFNGQDIANTLWALARAGARLSPLVEALSTRPAFDDLNSQELSMTAWALAKRNSKVDTILDKVASAALSKVDDFNSQELANTCWAFAKCRKLDILSDSFSAAAVKTIHTFEPQHLANTAWAFAKAGIPDHDLFVAIAGRAERTHFEDISRAQLRQAGLFLKHKAPSFKFPANLLFSDEDDPHAQDATQTSSSGSPETNKLCPHVAPGSSLSSN